MKTDYLLSVKKLVTTQTIKDSSITTIATVINGALGLTFYIIVARALGPSSYGLFAVALATLTLVADIANLGTDTGLIRFVSATQATEPMKALRFLKLALELKVAVWLAVLVGGWLLVPFIASNLLNKPELVWPFRYSLVGVGGALFFSFAANALQAYQKFISWSVLNISINALRLLAISLIIATLSLNLDSVMIVYISATFLGFFVGLMILPNFLKVKAEQVVASEFFHYNKWVALFVVLAALSSRLDLFLASRFLENRELGVYSAANQLVSVVPQLVFALATVAAPKLASLDSDFKAIEYLKKLQFLVLAMAGVGLLAIPMSLVVLPELYGPSFAGISGVFSLLFIAQLFFLISLPAHQSIFYYFSKPQIFVLVALIHLLVIGIGGLVLIDRFGAIGVAAAVLVGSLSNFILPLFWVVRNFQKRSQR